MKDYVFNYITFLRLKFYKHASHFKACGKVNICRFILFLKAGIILECNKNLWFDSDYVEVE